MDDYNSCLPQMCMMTMEELERKGMTLGAANKLFKKLDELRSLIVIQIVVRTNQHGMGLF